MEFPGFGFFEISRFVGPYGYLIAGYGDVCGTIWISYCRIYGYPIAGYGRVEAQQPGQSLAVGDVSTDSDI